MKSKFLLMVLMLPLCCSCGRKGPLVPPEALVPATVETLRVEQTGGDFRISWRAPGREQSGRPLRDLAGFRLLRRQVLPGEPDCAACSDAWQTIATVDLDLPRNVAQYGGYYLYRDGGVQPGVPTQYRLLAVSRSGGVSRPATSPVRHLLPVPPSPTLRATVSPTAVVLELDPGVMAGSLVSGFNLYRRGEGDDPAAPFPFSSVPDGARRYEDQRVDYGKVYRYAATTLVKVGDDLAESPPSPEIEVRFTEQELR